MAMNFNPYIDRQRIEEEMRWREKQAYERAKNDAMTNLLQYQNLGVTTISSAALGQIQGGAIAAAQVTPKPNPVLLLLEDV